MTKITVYRFKKFDINSNDEILSEFYATRLAIQEFRGVAQEESSIEIDTSQLDGNGRYKASEKQSL